VWKTRLQPETAARPIEVLLESIDAVHAGEYVARVGDAHHEVQVVRRGRHRGWLRIHGRVVPFFASRAEQTVEVWLGGRTYRFRTMEKTPARRAGASAGAVPQEEIKAPMPGTILKINVEVGDSFASHAPLIVMESMKMEMALSAPHAGRVREILCKVGELVPMGQVLARLEQEENDAAAASEDS
jgi:biotin carboxyl carrier protein